MFTRSHMAHSPTTIAFFARGREIGYVRLTNGQLVRYGVKTIKGPRRGSAFTRRVERALASVLQTMEPGGLIMLEQRGTWSTTGALCQAINKLSTRWKSQGYRVRFLALDDVKHEVYSDDQVTQQALIETIGQRYPLLGPLRGDPMVQRSTYWKTVFLAMALTEAGRQ